MNTIDVARIMGHGLSDKSVMEIAARLTASREEPEQSNARAALIEERRFEALLLAYILNDPRRFTFGGLTNLLTTIGEICEKLSLDDQAPNADKVDRNWERRAELVNACAREIDS